MWNFPNFYTRQSVVVCPYMLAYVYAKGVFKIKPCCTQQRSVGSALGDGYYITCLGRESNHLCPFSGDLNIFKGGECYAAATILQSGVDDADTDGAEPNPERLCHSPASGTPRPQVSPPKQGEYHCVTIENAPAPPIGGSCS